MSLMELFANPDTIETLTFGQKMQASTITMILGLGITFTILILIWIFIVIMGKCLNTTKKEKSQNPPTAAPNEAAPAAVAVSPEASDDENLVAVIAAAIAAYEGDGASNLVVKKIKRISGDNTPWGASGLEDRLQTRKF